MLVRNFATKVITATLCLPERSEGQYLHRLRSARH